MNAIRCPHCDLDLEDGRRRVGHTIRGVHHGVLYWSCPACGGRWHRFLEGNPLHAKCQALWNAWAVRR
jgi:hypothetical protein